MDASAYLKRHGWRGDGHSLDHTNRGIKKPLLVSQKVDVLGLGKDKHGPVSDQWWLRAFDQGLKNFGTGQQSVLASVQQHGINRGGLYGRFVQGERFEGSIGPSAENSGVSTPKELEDIPRDIAGDVPPRDGLEAAPESLEKLDRKRKRADRAVEKRARRKLEQGAETMLATREERKKQKNLRSVKGPEAVQKDADPLAEKNERAAKKEERRQRKAAEKARRLVSPAESILDDNVVTNGDAEHSTDDSTKSRNAGTVNSKQTKHKSEDGADEIKSGRTKKVKKKKTSGSGDIDSSALEKKTISPEKLQVYRQRAADKGMGLEEYIRRREQRTKLKSRLRS